MRLVITDSGLGGLSTCAALDAAVRRSARTRGNQPQPDSRSQAPVGIRLQPDSDSPAPLYITYVNAWPEEGRGYNDLRDMATQARVFDRALAAIEAMAPDQILIACNTLSIVYGSTDHVRHARTPTQGIIDAGVRLFAEALTARPASSLVLVGTRTTMESGVHRERVLAHGVAANRIGAASCHGLATAIENGPASDATETLIDGCARRAAEAAPAGQPLYAGLCCTHYGIVGERFGAALARHAGRPVELLDPNARVVQDIAPGLMGTTKKPGPGPIGVDSGEPSIAIEVVSKVVLPDDKRSGFAAVLEPVSPATAAALREYRHVPGLF